MCDTLAIVNSDGVLFAKNSDRDPNEAQFLDWQPRRGHPPGARLKCTWIEIPQVDQTYAVLLSRPYWMWGAEMGANEHGVTIGNEAVFTRQKYSQTGLLGMDLLRLALERAASADEAVQTIVSLLETHGQGGSCSLARPGFTYHNSFVVVDPRCGFMLETAGRHYAVEEIRGARSISNGLTIAGFAEQHSDRLKSRIAACRIRQQRTQQLANGAGDAGALMAALRDHGAGHAWPRYSWINGGLNAPCVHAGGLVASSQTTASWVADLRDSVGRHWVTGTSAPCVSLFKPVRVTEPIELGPAPGAHADDSLWWRHERLHRAVMRDPERLAKPWLAARDALERRWLGEPPAGEMAWREAGEWESRWLEHVMSSSTHETRPGWVGRFWRLQSWRAGLDAQERGMMPVS